MMRQSPDKIYGKLFVDCHMSGIWEDGKVISDAIPVKPVDEILGNYEKLKHKSDFNLKDFFESHFKYASIPADSFRSDTSMTVKEHVNRLWDHLSRNSDEDIEGSSLIPLPKPYVVPGGRFNEIYYWDSYFTMLGLVKSNRVGMVESMLQNFAWQIESIGFIPNGNRTYFLGRSQPPFFALMVELLVDVKGPSIYTNYLGAMIKEYHFWMDAFTDEETLEKNSGHSISVHGGVLNRYYDRFDTARPEMYGDDIELAEGHLEKKILFAHLRAACESGWDFSSRWLTDTAQLSTIHTLDILPIDLNCLLYNIEKTIAKAYKFLERPQLAKKYEDKANARQKLIQDIFWRKDQAFYFDYNYTAGQFCSVKSLAAMFPLFFKIANDEQAKAVYEIIRDEFLKEGGLLTTTIHSGQQWDAPNGWAPLQYIAIKGLERYGYSELADEIKRRWLTLNESVFKRTGKMLEKYNVEEINTLSGGGEYPVQDGFGWTNGVYLALK